MFGSLWNFLVLVADAVDTDIAGAACLAWELTGDVEIGDSAAATVFARYGQVMLGPGIVGDGLVRHPMRCVEG